MKIEYLYPEICCLYGEHANVTYIERSVPGCEVIGTSVNEKLRFLDAQDIDLVYMGTMTEESQEIAIDRLRISYCMIFFLAPLQFLFLYHIHQFFYMLNM